LARKFVFGLKKRYRMVVTGVALRSQDEGNPPLFEPLGLIVRGLLIPSCNEPSWYFICIS